MKHTTIKVLILDDDQAAGIANELREALNGVSAVVEFESNLEKAFARIFSDPPDIAVVDLKWEGYGEALGKDITARALMSIGEEAALTNFEELIKRNDLDEWAVEKYFGLGLLLACRLVRVPFRIMHTKFGHLTFPHRLTDDRVEHLANTVVNKDGSRLLIKTVEETVLSWIKAGQIVDCRAHLVLERISPQSNDHTFSIRNLETGKQGEFSLNKAPGATLRALGEWANASPNLAVERSELLQSAARYVEMRTDPLVRILDGLEIILPAIKSGDYDLDCSVDNRVYCDWSKFGYIPQPGEPGYDCMIKAMTCLKRARVREVVGTSHHQKTSLTAVSNDILQIRRKLAESGIGIQIGWPSIHTENGLVFKHGQGTFLAATYLDAVDS